MSESKHSVTYFGFRGRGEPIRVAFQLAGMEFDNKTVTGAEFGAAKADGSLPYGSLPVFTPAGSDVVYGQSNAILRYVGKLTGHYPEDPLEALLVDEVLDAVEETIGLLAPTFSMGDEEKIAARQALLEGAFGKKLAQINARFALNADSVYLGTSLTIAELKVSELVNWILSGNLDGIPAETITGGDYPALAALHADVEAKRTAALPAEE